MTWQEALEIEVGRSRVARYRWLCSDENPDDESRDAYRALMIQKATGEPESGIAPPDPWLPLIRACEHHNPGCCAHPAAFCSRFTKDVSREQCIECLTADGIGPRKG